MRQLLLYDLDESFCDSIRGRDIISDDQRELFGSGGEASYPSAIRIAAPYQAIFEKSLVPFGIGPRLPRLW